MINKLNKKNLGFEHYLVHEGCYSPRQPGNVTKTLSPGIYSLGKDQEGNLWFIPMSSVTDQLLNIPNTVSAKVLKEIETFWSAVTKAKFDDYGLVYKRGILLYGPPGTGKTCTIAMVMEEVVRAGGIVVFNPDPKNLSTAVSRMREIQPDLKVLAIFEEFDGLCKSSDFLSLLDGELQIENVIYIATTNYIDRIPPRIKNRPSRFASVIEIGAPDRTVREAYFTHKLKPHDLVDLSRWLELSEGMVIDQMKDLIVSVCCFGNTLEEAAKKIKDMGVLAGQEEKDEDDEEEESEPTLGQVVADIRRRTRWGR